MKQGRKIRVLSTDEIKRQTVGSQKDIFPHDRCGIERSCPDGKVMSCSGYDCRETYSFIDGQKVVSRVTCYDEDGYTLYDEYCPNTDSGDSGDSGDSSDSGSGGYVPSAAQFAACAGKLTYDFCEWDDGSGINIGICMYYINSPLSKLYCKNNYH